MARVIQIKQAEIDKLRALDAAIPKLPSGRQNFARDLIANWNRYKSLSVKQWEWVEKLIEMAKTPPIPTPTVNLPVPGFDKIEALLRSAMEHITWPRIRLQVGSGKKLEMWPKQHGRGVVIKFDGWRLGHIEKENMEFLPTARDVDRLDWELRILPKLLELVANPQETAAKYGHETHHCCFCGLTLTDERSTRVGYGPICAENYGLPWGETPETAKLNELYGEL